MPYYDYTCPECAATHTARRSVEDRDAPMFCLGAATVGADAAHVESVPMKRAVSGAAFALKGGGWYADGYAKR